MSTIIVDRQRPYYLVCTLTTDVLWAKLLVHLCASIVNLGYRYEELIEQSNLNTGRPSPGNVCIGQLESRQLSGFGNGPS